VGAGRAAGRDGFGRRAGFNNDRLDAFIAENQTLKVATNRQRIATSPRPGFGLSAKTPRHFDGKRGTTISLDGVCNALTVVSPAQHQKNRAAGDEALDAQEISRRRET
jgi:hypothetical protein